MQAAQAQSTTIGDPAQAREAAALLARVRAAAPSLAGGADVVAESGRLDARALAVLEQTGVLRACVPRHFGGLQLPYRTFVDAAIELGRYCGATAWLAGVFGSNGWRVAKCGPAIQDRIWREGADAIVCGAFASRGVATRRVADGYLVSGEWMFCSGIHHAQCVSLLVPLPDDDGKPRPCFAYIPRAEVETLPTWRSVGMRGTGSDNVVVRELFVPDSMLAPYAEVDSAASPGQAIHGSPVYRLALTWTFAYSVAGPLIGTAEGCLAAFVDDTRLRTVVMSDQKVAELVPVQLRIAESAAEIATARLAYQADMEFLSQAGEAARDLGPMECATLRRNAAYVATLCRRATTRVVEALGARGLDPQSPARRLHADTCAGAAHMALSWDLNAMEYARRLLAGPGITQVVP